MGAAGILLVSGSVNSTSPGFLARCMFYGAFVNVAGVIVVVSLVQHDQWHAIKLC